MNDIVGPEGLMPSALVLGEYPRVVVAEEPLPKRSTTSSRIQLMVSARKEMEEQLAKDRITRALRHKTPSAARKTYKKGDKVLIWREKIVKSRIGEWSYPFEVRIFNPRTKLVFVKDSVDRRARLFGIAQVKPYLEPEDVAESFFCDIDSGLRRFSSTCDSELPIFLTEVLEPKDPRARSPQMTDAMRKEVQGLIERGAFKVILPVPSAEIYSSPRLHQSLNSSCMSVFSYSSPCMDYQSPVITGSTPLTSITAETLAWPP